MEYAKLVLMLDVLHKAAAAGPKYQWIVDAAEKEIMKLKPASSVDPVPPVGSFPASSPPHAAVKDENYTGPHL